MIVVVGMTEVSLFGDPPLVLMVQVSFPVKGHFKVADGVVP